MSHQKQRKETNCLNCGTEVAGRYCQQCGQENIEPKDSVWGLVRHFFEDITHFDGKFFATFRTMIRKPGFLTKEYLAGRRMRYLNPIRMYVFSSALFFLIFYNMFSVKYDPMAALADNVFTDNDSAWNLVREKGRYLVETEKDSLGLDSAIRFFKGISRAISIEADSTGKIEVASDSSRRWKISRSFDRNFKNRKEYDSLQAALPESERDNWFVRQIRYKNFDIEKKYGNNEKLLLTELANKFIHTLPYLLFLSLPLYALFLKLIYARRKQYFYVSHVLFLVHLYIFTFLYMLILSGMEKLMDVYDTWWMYLIMTGLLLYGVYYAYRSMRNFYEQGFFKTLMKFLLFNVFSFVVLLLLFTVFLSLTVFQL